MRFRDLLVGVVLGAGLAVPGQGIRKDFREMTYVEKMAYRQVVESFWNSDPAEDFVEMLRAAHQEHAFVVHSNPNNVSEQFFPWHRMILWEMENALQNHNAALSLPYWDWRAVRDTTDSLFQYFLALPIASWDISRSLNLSPNLPTTEEVECVQDKANLFGSGYTTCGSANGYSSNMEEGIHQQPHGWVHGSMLLVSAAPRDPLFYLHHAMVDKLWQEWEEVHGNSSFSISALERYDGTEVSPDIDPSEIIDSRKMWFGGVGGHVGVFYSKDGLVKLNGGYQVDNTFHATEHFVFTGTIEGGSFDVPVGKSAIIHSGSKIVLKSGFASHGNLVLKVGDYDDNFTSSLAKLAVPQKPSPDSKTAVALLDDGILRVDRVPGGLEVAFRLNEGARILIDIFDPAGRRLNLTTAVRMTPAGEHVVKVPMRDYRGIVYLSLRAGKKIHRKVVMLI
jgi:hypothetical protein